MPTTQHWYALVSTLCVLRRGAAYKLSTCRLSVAEYALVNTRAQRVRRRAVNAGNADSCRMSFVCPILAHALGRSSRTIPRWSTPPRRSVARSKQLDNTAAVSQRNYRRGRVTEEGRTRTTQWAIATQQTSSPQSPAVASRNYSCGRENRTHTKAMIGVICVPATARETVCGIPVRYRRGHAYKPFRGLKF